MSRTTHPFIRLAALVTTVLGLVLITAGQATAMRPDPGSVGSGDGYQGSGTSSILNVTNSSVSALEWVLFAAAVVGALLVGAALTHLAERNHGHLAH